MVDVGSFNGDYYDSAVVTNNLIVGGFASETAKGSETKGTNKYDAIIKCVYFLIIPNGLI